MNWSQLVVIKRPAFGGVDLDHRFLRLDTSSGNDQVKVLRLGEGDLLPIGNDPMHCVA